MNIANLIGAVATLGWVAVVGAVALVIVRSARNRPLKAGVTIVAVTVVVAILLSSISAGLVFINPEERGVVISAVSPTGYRNTILEPGLRWIIPFAESVITYPISKQTYTMSIAPGEGNITGDDSIEARTADGQVVYVDASIIFSIDPTQVIQVHIAWQDRYADGLVRPSVRGVIRDAVSQFKIEEAYSTRRTEMVEVIQAGLQTKLAENGLLLTDFILRNITFSPEYSASVEQKQIAQQLAEQAAFTVDQRRQEAEQARQVAQGQADSMVISAQGEADARVIQAQAEAQALNLIAEALKDKPDLLTYQYITKLSPQVQVMFLPNSSPFIFPLPNTQTTTTNQTTTSPEVVPTP